MVQSLSCRDDVRAITGSAFGGELLLVNLDVFGSLDHTCMQNMLQTRSPKISQRKRKINQVYSKIDLDLDDS